MNELNKFLKILEEDGFKVPHSISNEMLLLTPEFWKRTNKLAGNRSGYLVMSRIFMRHMMLGGSFDSYFGEIMSDKHYNVSKLKRE